MLQSFSEALKRLGLWEPHGWSHLDHDSLFGQIGLVTPLSLEPRCCFDHLLLFGPEPGCWLVTFCSWTIWSCFSPLSWVAVESHFALWTVWSRFSLWSQVTPWVPGSKAQLCDQITSRNLHGSSTDVKFFPTADQVGWWQPSGW